MPDTVFVIRVSSPEGYTCLSLFGTFLGKSGHPSTPSLPKVLNLRVVTRFDVVAQVTNFLED
jgi:hypothetical protein